MPMSFEGETLTIGGREYVGTVFIETEVGDASFDHEFGTERAISVTHYSEGFYANGVSRCMAESIDAHAGPALEAWLTSNLRRVEQRFEMECKQGV